jgi:hypothetical protein
MIKFDSNRFPQIDIHVFGGNATSSLLSSMFCLCRSLLSVGVLVKIYSKLKFDFKIMD